MGCTPCSQRRAARSAVEAEQLAADKFHATTAAHTGPPASKFGVYFKDRLIREFPSVERATMYAERRGAGYLTRPMADGGFVPAGTVAIEGEH